jgi:hypothetical protein
MIKDRVIQKRIKGKVLAMAMTAVMASFFVPLGVGAVDGDTTGGGTGTNPTPPSSGSLLRDADIVTTDVIIEGTECYTKEGKCQGHLIDGKGQKVTKNTIKVQGGIHDITLKNVIIDVSTDENGNPTSKTAFELTDNSTRVNLTLEGTNSLTSGKNCAGIHVPASATLNITEDSTGASLDAKGGMAGAGIGGAGAPPNAGTITISAGTINATGGDEAAGIGSFQNGTVKAITINGGTIYAKGGTYADGKGGAGIGYGTGTGSNLNLEINGGNVKAFGGTGKGGLQADGISCGAILSVTGNDGLITTNKLKTSSPTGLKNFQGIIWTGIEDPGPGQDADVTGKKCVVHGDAALPDVFKLPAGSEMEIPAGASLTLPSDTKWDYAGKITGKGTIINANNLSPSDMAGWSGLKDMKLTVTLNEKDFIPTSCMFTGENLIDEAVRYNGKRDEGDGKVYDVVVPKSWERRITDEAGNSIVDDDGKAQMIDAGTYIVEYVNTKDADSVMVSKEIIIKPRPLTDCKISDIESPMYTGTTVKPEISIKYEPTNYDLVESKDFGITYEVAAPENRVNAGTYQITIYGIKNFTDTKEDGGMIDKEFTIRKASLEELNTTIRLPANRVYDGTEFIPKPDAVVVEGVYADKDTPGLLNPAEDYEVTYSPEDFISAGEITVTVTGKGKNFEDSATAVYTVNKKPLTVTSVTAEDRIYDATTNVKVVDIKVDMTGAIKGDEADIEVNPEAVIGLISQPDVGEYYDIKFGDAPLAGAKGKNYCLDVTKSYPLTKAVKITQREAPTIKLDVAKYVVSQNPDAPNTFTCYVNVTGATANDIIDPTGKIMFCMDVENPDPDDSTIWKEGQLVSLGLDPENPDVLTLVGEFDGIAPGSTHTFYAYTDGTKNVKKSAVGSCTRDFEKLPQDPPEKCELAVSEEPNADGETFTATVTPFEEGRYEYSFDNQVTYGTSNIYEGCLPGTKYIAYMRYAETATHKASEGVPSNEVTTKKLKAKAPIIEVAAGGTTFRGRTNVVISYPTAMPGISIYYTTNGSEPNENSTLYTDQFQITDTTTVKAIAVSDTLEKSDTASVTLEKTGDTVVQSFSELKPGLTDNMIAESLYGRMLGDNTTVVDGAEAVTSYMTALLSEKPGYVYDNVAVYDLTIKIAVYDEKGKIIDRVDPTEQDFPIKVELTYDQLQFPEGITGTTHDFAVSHMFAQEIGGHTPGETEEPTVEKTDKGLSFYVNGTSPLAVAWKTADSNNPDNPDDPDDPNNPDNPDDPNNPDNPDDPNNPDNPDDPNNPDNPDPNANGDGTGNQNGDGTNGNGTTSSTNAAEQGASDDSKSALSNLMPKTGDPISFIPWIAAAVVSIGVIVGIVKKKNGKKKKPNKTTKKTTQKSTQKTKKKK